MIEIYKNVNITKIWVKKLANKKSVMMRVKTMKLIIELIH